MGRGSVSGGCVGEVFGWREGGVEVGGRADVAGECASAGKRRWAGW